MLTLNGVIQLMINKSKIPQKLFIVKLFVVIDSIWSGNENSKLPFKPAY